MRRDRRGRRIGHNWWREYVWNVWHAADHAWWLAAEDVTMLYATELADYRREHPRPTFKDCLIGLAGTHQGLT